MNAFPSARDQCMLRGGGWNGAALTQRSGYRNDNIVEAGNSFRVVRTLAVAVQ